MRDITYPRRHAKATNGGKDLNTSTFVKLVDSNPSRKFFQVCNCGLQPVSIFLGSAGDATDGAGIEIPGKSFWRMPDEYIFTGEICAIAKVENSFVKFTEF